MRFLSFSRSLACGIVLLGSLCTMLLAAPKVGMDAPDFSILDIEGRPYSLRDFRGKTVVLEWVNPECPFVKKHYESGNMPRLQKEATDDGVIWLSINSGHAGAQGDFEPAKVVEWQDRTGAKPTAYLRDQTGGIGRLYDAKTTPHIFVINPAGVLVYDGAIDSIRSANPRDIGQAENYVTSSLRAVSEGRMPDKSTSEPYGCTVKY